MASEHLRLHLKRHWAPYPQIKMEVVQSLVTTLTEIGKYCLTKGFVSGKVKRKGNVLEVYACLCVPPYRLNYWTDSNEWVVQMLAKFFYSWVIVFWKLYFSFSVWNCSITPFENFTWVHSLIYNLLCLILIQ